MNFLFVVVILGWGYVPSLAADPDPADQRLTAAQAQTLALKVHAETSAMDRLPRFSYRIESGNGDVDTMRDRDECSAEGLTEALDGPVAKAEWLQWGVTFAWTEKHAFFGHGDEEGVRFEGGPKDSRQDRVWTKDLAFQRSASADDPARFVYTSTANQLWEMRLRELAYFRVTPHRFWWATSDHHIDMLSSIPPEQANYRWIKTEVFDDELCQVLESPARAERMWIGLKSERLHGVLVYHYRGGGAQNQFYKSEQLQKIAGRSFATRQKFSEWTLGNSISSRQKLEIAVAWNELYFDAFGPNELIRFRDYREVAPGVWIPFREDRAFTHPTEENRKRRKYIRLWVAVKEVRTDVDLTETVESLHPQEGEQIQDQRFGLVVNYKFRSDRTQSELLELIDAEVQKQAANAEVLKRLIAPVEELIGKAAPELPVEGWVGGPRPNLKDRPYLLHFWATWCGPCKNDLPFLTKLAADGVLVVGMHPAGTSTEEVTQVIDDQKLGYPTYLATTKTDGDERKIGGFPAAMFPYCILVDRTGRIAGHGSFGPEIVAKLRSLLDKE